MKKNDIVVEMLHFGFKRAGKTFKLNDLLSHLEKCGYKTEESKITIKLFFEDNFSTEENDDDAYLINSDGYFRYLQYQDLKDSKWNSWVAIGISIFFAIVSLFSSYALTVLYTSTVKLKLDKYQQEQVEEKLKSIDIFMENKSEYIIEQNNKSDSIINRLDKLILIKDKNKKN